MKAVLDYLPPMPEIGMLGSRASFPEADVEMRTIDPFGSEWDQLALSHPDASFFHSSAWARTLTKTYGHKPFYLSFFSSGAPQALVPMMEVTSAFTGRRGVGLPFSDCCSPLLFQNGDKSFILSRLSALASEHAWKYFELRDPRSLELSVDPAIQYFSHSLNLQPGPDALFAGFSSPVRRAIRKAEKSKLSVRVSQSLRIGAWISTTCMGKPAGAMVFRHSRSLFSAIFLKKPSGRDLVSWFRRLSKSAVSPPRFSFDSVARRFTSMERQTRLRAICGPTTLSCGRRSASSRETPATPYTSGAPRSPTRVCGGSN